MTWFYRLKRTAFFKQFFGWIIILQSSFIVETETCLCRSHLCLQFMCDSVCQYG